MNIKEAKEQIKNAMTAYFTKNEYGEYVISIEKQRPLFLMGPPGIGKTAIMEQVAQELGVGLVTYSMTHHTRQSAIGLPFIEKKMYGGVEYSVSEYTMSEIIASVYDMMERTGFKEGILFLDEINCVSETLAPAMLQFLQYKIFGRHRVPNGWIVVTAGNPPEYNNSVREFDIVTWDRLKRIDIDPDYTVWKEYAYKKGLHASIITYLEIKKDNFYKIETTVDGKSFVTARGWSDLSDIIWLYEKHKIKVDQKLVEQYLQNKKIAKDFAVYYDLFKKYKSDYQINDILAGRASDEVKKRAKSARFDERITLMGLILESITEKVKEVCDEEQTLKTLMPILRNIKPELLKAKDHVLPIEKAIELQNNNYKTRKEAANISDEDSRIYHKTDAVLNDISLEVKKQQPNDGEQAFKIIKSEFDKRTSAFKLQVNSAKMNLSNVFKFCEEVFSEGQEILVLVTELTMGYYSAQFISRYGCDEYFAHNRELLFYERNKEIITELNFLELDVDEEEMI